MVTAYAFLLIMILTAITVVLIVVGPNKTANIDTDTEQPDEETYGNPQPPVPLIRKGLPPLIYPYMWETWVDSTPISATMTIQLITIATDVTETKRVLARKTVNLRALADTYRNHPTFTFKWSTMRNDMINPTITWAERTAAEHCDYQPERTDYDLG